MSADLAVTAPLTAAAARQLTDEIRVDLSTTYDKITAAFVGRAWEALGYLSWHSYCAGEFADARMVRMDPVQRSEISADMRKSGMSTRAIGSALGVSHTEVQRSLPGGTDVPPGPVTGTDGKTYPATQPVHTDRDGDRETARAEAEFIATFDPPQPETSDVEPEIVTATEPRTPNRRPLVDAWRDTAIDLNRLAERIERLSNDDRFTRNAEQLAAVSRYELSHTVELLAKALDALPTTEATA